MVSVVIPAYNEESTIEGVIEAVMEARCAGELVVVSDGSSDRTALLAKQLGAVVIELPRNMGKGAAIKAGLEKCSGQVILLLDADLVGLTPRHVTDLIEPVMSGRVDMSVGVFSKGRFSTDLAHRLSPFLSGQRAIKREVIDKLQSLERKGYGVEAALSVFVRKSGIKVVTVKLESLTHVMKEEKLGIWAGFLQRMVMYWQIVKAMLFQR